MVDILFVLDNQCWSRVMPIIFQEVKISEFCFYMYTHTYVHIYIQMYVYVQIHTYYCCCSVAKSCLTFCDPMD